MTPDNRLAAYWIAILAIPAMAAGAGVGALTQPAAHQRASVASNMTPPTRDMPTVTAAPTPAQPAHTRAQAPRIIVNRIPVPAAPVAPQTKTTSAPPTPTPAKTPEPTAEPTASATPTVEPDGTKLPVADPNGATRGHHNHG